MKTMLFISQPMRGLEPETIKETQQRLLSEYQAKYPDKDIELINPYMVPDPQIEISHIIGNHHVKMLGEAISTMSYADVVLFARAWENFAGCRIEHKVCTYYNIPVEYAR